MIYILTFIVPFIIDRVSKILAITYASTNPISVAPGVAFGVIKNRGLSWSLLSSEQTYPFVLTTILIMCVIAIFSYTTYCDWRTSKSIIGNVLILSGALSNLYDRFVYCGVIDFIHLSYKNWHFPIFNLADCFITLGVAIILIQLIKK